MIETMHQQRDADTQHIPIDTLQRIQRIVLEETQGGRTIIRNLVSIMNGDDPDGKPSHRLQSARILLRLGFEEAREALGNSGAPGKKTPSPSMGEGWDGGDVSAQPQDGSQPAQQPLSPEHEKVNKKLVARIRVDSEGGASMVRVLLEILEGNDPDARTRDRIEAAKVLLHWGFGNPAQPDPDFMMFYAPCHPDCLCVCKDLDEDHPDVIQSHTPPTEEQREAWAREQEILERAAETAERKARADRAWRLEQSYSPVAQDDRRLEREERRLKRERNRNRSP